jgi:hypothetical protein
MKTLLKFFCLYLLTSTVAAFISRHLEFYPGNTSWYFLNFVLYLVFYNLFDGVLMFCYSSSEELEKIKQGLRK